MYSLLQTDSNHLRGDASVQLIAIQNHASIATDATYIEADLNTDEPFFVYATGVNSQRLPETFFDTNRNIIDAVSRTIINPVDSSILPDEVNEIAITIGDATNTANSPTNQPDSLVCGGQRLSDNVRIFCWQPTPFESPTFLFEESRVNGSLTYRLITR